MKIKLLPIFTILLGGVSFAQNAGEVIPEEIVSYNHLGQKVITTHQISVHKTEPMRDHLLTEAEFAAQLQEVDNDFEDERANFDFEAYEEALNNIDPNFVDPARQENYGTRQNRAPIKNWAGQTGSGYPPDPTGAAGENYYVQGVNTSVRVWNKDGTSPGPGSIFSLSSLWSGSSNMGDPIVLYDRHAQRWFISQFNQSPNRILIAISETSDPLGSYYSYSFTLNNFPDYPKYSIWWDGYYMSSNSNQTAVVFQRDSMLVGGTAQMINMSLPQQHSMGFKGALPADADGDLPPAGTPQYFFNLEDDAFNGVSTDGVKIWEMTCDWSNTANSTVTSSGTLPVTAFNSLFSGNWSNISQPGTTQGLDAIMGVLMFRAQHTRWIDHNSIVLSHVVNQGSNRAAIRWYELRDAHDGNWTVYQEGTFDPDNRSRWMSSIAMDNMNNIGMAYSLSDGNSTYPSLAYTGRMYWDPLHTMSFTEQIAIDGTGSQTSLDRFGDYAHLSLDPDGKTFWYTGEYLAPGKKTRVFSFSLQDEAGLDNPYYENLAMTVFQNASDLNVKVEGIYGEEDVTVDLITMNGQTAIENNGLKPTSGQIDMKMDVTGLSNGIYFVRVGNPSFQKVEKIFIKE